MSWLYPIVLGVVATWAAILFIDSLLRTCQNYPYIWLMERTGVVLKFGQIRWTTTYYNRFFVWLANRKAKFFKVWFNIGAFVTILLVLPSIVILSTTIILNLFPPEGDKNHKVLSAVLPGVNLPTGDIPFYLITLIFCVVFHELGHALAAVGEEVRVLGSGLTVVGILPAAFVDISTEQVHLLNPWRQLKVFCAGIWHNVFLVLVAIFLLIVAPHAFSLGYSHGSGVVVREIQEKFPSGLSVGDHITSVNGCPISDLITWHKCLRKVATQPHDGFCITVSYLDNYKWNNSGLTIFTEVIDCCSPNDPRGVCFAWLNPSPERQKIQKFGCLPARQVLNQSSSNCFTEEECDTFSYCIVPALDNSTRLVRIVRVGQEDILYICPVADLYYSVKLSNYVPKLKFLPISAPHVFETLLEYVISFSGALAILNAVPCYALDGQWITTALIELGLSKVLQNRRTRNSISRATIITGTILLILTVITGLKSIL